jgi:hypothetical protein
MLALKKLTKAAKKISDATNTRKNRNVDSGTMVAVPSSYCDKENKELFNEYVALLEKIAFSYNLDECCNTINMIAGERDKANELKIELAKSDYLPPPSVPPAEYLAIENVKKDGLDERQRQLFMDNMNQKDNFSINEVENKTLPSKTSKRKIIKKANSRYGINKVVENRNSILNLPEVPTRPITYTNEENEDRKSILNLPEVPTAPIITDTNKKNEDIDFGVSKPVAIGGSRYRQKTRSKRKNRNKTRKYLLF